MSAPGAATAPGPPWKVALGVQAIGAQSAWQGVRLMIAYQALAETGSPVFVGVVAAVFALAGLAVAMPLGRLMDRYGSAPIASAGMTVMLVGIIVSLTVPSIPGMILAAAIIGCGHIGTVIGQQSLIPRLIRSAPDAAFGTLTAAVSVGQLVGPPLVTGAAMIWATSPTHPETWVGMACSGLLVLVSLPSMLFLHRAERAFGPPTRTEHPRLSLRQVLAVPGMLRSILVGAALIVTVDLLSSFIPIWAVEQHIPAVVVGWLLALRSLFTISSRFGMSRLVERFGRKSLLLVAISLAVAALLALPFANAWAAIPIMAALGLGLGLPQPITLAWMTLLAPPHARGAAFGVRMSLNRFAQVVLPLFVASTAGPFGVLAVFWSTAAILAGGIVVVALTTATVLDDRGSPDDVARDASAPEDS